MCDIFKHKPPDSIPLVNSIRSVMSMRSYSHWSFPVFQLKDYRMTHCVYSDFLRDLCAFVVNEVREPA